MRHETAILGEKPNPEIPVIIIFGSFPSLSTTKKQKSVETPIFVVFQQAKKRSFSKNELKTEKCEKPNCCALELKKAILRNLADNWAQKKTK